MEAILCLLPFLLCGINAQLWVYFEYHKKAWNVRQAIIGTSYDGQV